jgi:hypothetical protein
MTLKKFIEKYELSDFVLIDKIPIKHPETGEKIYIVSNWMSGFWYRKLPSQKEGQMWPVQYPGDLNDLEVHKDAKKELEL